MSDITVTVNGNAVSYTTYNPYTGLTPTTDQWYYYLVNGSSSVQTVTILTGGTSLSAICFCLIGPGGFGGVENTTQTSGGRGGCGGGGGSGTVLMLNYTSYDAVDQTFTVTLQPLGSSINSTLQNPPNIAQGTKYSAYYGRPGDDGSAPTSESGGDGGKGGNGGNGDKQNSHNACPSVGYNGGGGGNGGEGGNGEGNSETASAGSNGTTGDSYWNATSAQVGAGGNSECPVNFEDGQNVNINYGGNQNSSGPGSSVMIYYYISTTIA